MLDEPLGDNGTLVWETGLVILTETSVLNETIKSTPLVKTKTTKGPIKTSELRQNKKSERGVSRK